MLWCRPVIKIVIGLIHYIIWGNKFGDVISSFTPKQYDLSNKFGDEISSFTHKQYHLLKKSKPSVGAHWLEPFPRVSSGGPYQIR